MRGALAQPWHPAALLLLAACAAPPPASVTADSAAVAALVRERIAAAAAGDTARWHRQVSDSALWTGPALATVRTPVVLPIIAANRGLRPPPSELRELAVYVDGPVAQATYLQLVPGPDAAPRSGKRFRKTDVYRRDGAEWRLVGATEIAVPYRPTRPLGPGRAAAIAGRYVLPGVDTLVLTPTDSGVLLGATDGSLTPLLVADDTTLFEEGDAGAWIVPMSPAPAPRLIYRAPGAGDIVLTRQRSD